MRAKEGSKRERERAGRGGEKEQGEWGRAKRDCKRERERKRKERGEIVETVIFHILSPSSFFAVWPHRWIHRRPAGPSSERPSNQPASSKGGALNHGYGYLAPSLSLSLPQLVAVGFATSIDMRPPDDCIDGWLAADADLSIEVCLANRERNDRKIIMLSCERQ